MEGCTLGRQPEIGTACGPGMVTTFPFGGNRQLKWVPLPGRFCGKIRENRIWESSGGESLSRNSGRGGKEGG